ncbi:MAG: NUDIX hydrolase [Ferrimicrobium sp.]
MRRAATVMMVRPAIDETFEVLMLKRSKDLTFVGGAYVFPGGKVDVADGSPEILARCDGLVEADARRALGVDELGVAHYVAAVREVFEEAGVLIGSTDGVGKLPALTELPPVGDDLDLARGHLLEGSWTFLDVLEYLGVRLSLDRLFYVAHWVTPEPVPKRFDTRFFVVSVRRNQKAREDASETVEHCWISPSAALDAYRAGELPMVIPTVRSLEYLASFGELDQLLQNARETTFVPAIMPRLMRTDHGIEVVTPDDPRYGDVVPIVLEGGEGLSVAPTVPTDRSET